MSLSQECQVAGESTGWDVYCRSSLCQGNLNKPYKNILSFLFILDFWSYNYLIYQTWFIEVFTLDAVVLDGFELRND